MEVPFESWAIEVSSDHYDILSVPFTGKREFAARGIYESAQKIFSRMPDYVVLVAL